MTMILLPFETKAAPFGCEEDVSLSKEAPSKTKPPRSETKTPLRIGGGGSFDSKGGPPETKPPLFEAKEAPSEHREAVSVRREAPRKQPPPFETKNAPSERGDAVSVRKEAPSKTRPPLFETQEAPPSGARRFRFARRLPRNRTRLSSKRRNILRPPTRTRRSSRGGRGPRPDHRNRTQATQPCPLPHDAARRTSSPERRISLPVQTSRLTGDMGAARNDQALRHRPRVLPLLRVRHHPRPARRSR